MKKIIYQCNRQPDHFTLHALFNSVTNNFYTTIISNMHAQPRMHKTWFNDRIITIIVEDDVPLHLTSYQFSHYDGIISLKPISCEDIGVEQQFTNSEFVVVEGVISYCIHATTEQHGRTNSRGAPSKKICPIDLKGNFVLHKTKDGRSARQCLMDYLKTHTGLNVDVAQIDQRADVRFEPLNYKTFQRPDGQQVHSKRNGQQIDIHNAFYFHATAQVVDAEKTNNLSVTSIGRRRSYGFGNLVVSSIVQSIYEQKTI